jgi:hypothetical protein
LLSALHVGTLLAKLSAPRSGLFFGLRSGSLSRCKQLLGLRSKFLNFRLRARLIVRSRGIPITTVCLIAGKRRSS